MYWHYPCSTLFPYTTLFRSERAAGFGSQPGDLLLDRHVLRHRLLESHDIGVGAALRLDSQLAHIGRGLDEEVPRSESLFGVERSEEHTSELQSRRDLVCRLL